MGQTEKYKLPYPSEEDYLKDTATFIKNLAESVEETIKNNSGITELVGTETSAINANEIIDIGIYKISGVIENFHNNIVYNQFIMYVNWDEYKLVQTIIGEGCIYYRAAEEFRGSFNWSDWQLQSSGGITGGDTLPIGTILPFGSDTVPDNYLLCKGQELPRAEFRELFGVIGTTYGEGDGSTTFALPNLCGRVPVGKDSDDTDFDTLGKTGGEKIHTLTVDEMPSHTHKIARVGSVGSAGYNSWYQSSTVSEEKMSLSSTGGDQPHNNLQPYIVTNYIIKAKNTAIIKGEVIQETGTASETNVYSAVAIDNKIAELVEKGSNANGYYEKWSDGTLKCWGKKSCGTIAISTSFGALFVSAAQTFDDFPVKFIETPVITKWITNNGASCWAINGLPETSETTPGGINLVGVVNANATNVIIQYMAVGKWK